MSRIYLYNEGDECVSITGGWVLTRWTATSSSLTKNTNSMTAQFPRWSDGSIETVNDIDFFRYKTLTVEWTRTGSDAYMSFVAPISNPIIASGNIIKASPSEFDISSLDHTGKVSFSMANTGTATITITKIYVEDDKIPVSMVWDTEPTKVNYSLGEALDVTGGTLLVTFDDDSLDLIPMQLGMVSGYESMLPHSNQTLTVTYGGLVLNYSVYVSYKDKPKEFGKFLVLKFNEKLNTIPQNQYTMGVPFRPIGVVTESAAANSTYLGSKAFDGNTTTQWYATGTGAKWLKIVLPNPIATTGIRLMAPSYAPKNCTIEGSNDGVAWVTLATPLFQNKINDWQNVEFALCEYSQFRFNFSNTWESHLMVYEIEFFSPRLISGNEKAFTISGVQEKHVLSGHYFPVVPFVYGVFNHPILDEYHLLIMLHGYPVLKNTVGAVTISYDKLKGTLSGRGGAVESFDVSFTPSDLQTLVNPNIEDTVRVASSVSFNLTPVNYPKVYNKNSNYLNVSASVSVILTDIGIENP